MPVNFLQRLHDAAAPPSAVPGPLDGFHRADHHLRADGLAATGSPPVDAPSADASHPPEDLMNRLGEGQRSSFAAVWQKLPAFLREIKFDFHGPGWTPKVITDLGDLLSEFSGVFSSSLADLGACSLLPIEIEVPPCSAPVTL